MMMAHWMILNHVSMRRLLIGPLGLQGHAPFDARGGRGFTGNLFIDTLVVAIIMADTLAEIGGTRLSLLLRQRRRLCGGSVEGLVLTAPRVEVV